MSEFSIGVISGIFFGGFTYFVLWRKSKQRKKKKANDFLKELQRLNK